MKELRELRQMLSDATPGEWETTEYSHNTDVYVETNDDYLPCTIARCAKNGEDARLIAAMHNALPELLDAWEMVQAVIEFTDVHRGDVVEVTQDVGYSWCISDLNKILKPYSGRDAHADTKAD